MLTRSANFSIYDILAYPTFVTPEISIKFNVLEFTKICVYTLKQQKHMTKVTKIQITHTSNRYTAFLYRTEKINK